jgi:hypothetical protein
MLRRLRGSTLFSGIALTSVSTRRARAGSLTTLAGALGLAASCSAAHTKPRGELMVAVATDLSITKDVDRVGFEVFNEKGQILRSQELELKPDGSFAMPGTIALVPAAGSSRSVRVRVSARHTLGGSETTSIVREAIARIPNDRVALLRMPLNWLCQGQVKLDGQSGGTDRYSSDCPQDQTCKAGTCQSADVTADDMPNYSAALVYGGGDAHGNGSYCLDVATCFGGNLALVKPRASDCSVPFPAGTDPTSLNVALVLPPATDGHCVDDPSAGPQGGNCYIPLDQDPVEGYFISDNRIILPAPACVRASVSGIAVSTVCPKKDLSVPVCGPWTGWNVTPGGQGGTTGVGAEGGASGEAGASNSTGVQ